MFAGVVKILVEPWHYCHIYGRRTNARERKDELIKNYGRENGLVFERLTPLPLNKKGSARGERPRGAQP
jgi:hypothetical protein